MLNVQQVIAVSETGQC